MISKSQQLEGWMSNHLDLPWTVLVLALRALSISIDGFQKTPQVWAASS